MRLASLPLWPFAAAFAGVARARSALYDSGAFRAIDAGIPVVAVGNVTAGGTGKTPVVEALVRGLIARGRKPAVVTRGYGGSERGPARVPSDPGNLDAARMFGDEPTWLARAHPRTPVVVGRDRVAAARAALALGADCAVADDAFQHRRLARRFDLVVLDATEPRWHYWPLPAGRARESLSALRRADAVVINKVNLVSPERLADLRSALGGASAIECGYAIHSFGDLASGNSAPIAEASGRRAFCATGIGRPGAFRATLRASAPGAQIVGWRDFPDHRAFGPADFDAIERDAATSGADVIFVSEKDAVKMGGWRPRLPVFVTRLSVEPKEGWDRLHDQIAEALR